MVSMVLLWRVIDDHYGWRLVVVLVAAMVVSVVVVVAVVRVVVRWGRLVVVRWGRVVVVVRRRVVVVGRGRWWMVVVRWLVAEVHVEDGLSGEVRESCLSRE